MIKLTKKITTKQISKLIDIYPPFLLVDQIKFSKNQKSAIGLKKLKKKDWFFKNHISKSPTLPGSILIETMLQTTVAVIYNNYNIKTNVAYVTSLKTNLLNKVKKPTQLMIKTNLIKIEKPIILAKAHVFDINTKKKIAFGNFIYFF